MTDRERMERAYLLRLLRNNGRLPRWLNDKQICHAVEAKEFRQPPSLTRAIREMVRRRFGVCKFCRCKCLLGCCSCWATTQIRTIPDLETQAAILKAARHQSILPTWLNNFAISRALGLDRYRIGRMNYPGQLCINCGDSGIPSCLACSLTEFSKIQPSVSRIVPPR